MLAVLFIVFSYINGYILLKIFFPKLFDIENSNEYNSKAKLPKFMIIIPMSYILGTLILSWTSYIFAWLFRNAPVYPLAVGNIAAFSLSTIIIITYVILYKKNSLLKEIINDHKINFRKHRIEIFYSIIALIIVSWYMFHVFFIEGSTLYVGATVFSDFGPHLSLIRSFSVGSNFPTQYPHFADGDIKYHFMFQFMCGNLEFLGLPIDWAFNLPSIISLVGFFMMLYSVALLIFGVKDIAILSGTLFYFRSSFAFFTYVTDGIKNGTIKSLSDLVKNIATINVFIGKTEHEEWGLYAQNVYLNQRHLAFALCILAFAIIIFLPYFNKMTNLISVSIRKTKKNIQKNDKSDKIQKTNESRLSIILKEFIFKSDSWKIYSISTAVCAGFFIGLMGYWNGAVFISILLVLFVIAIFSKNRLDYIVTAGLALSLFVFQLTFFSNSANVTSKPHLQIGYLAKFPDNLQQTLTALGTNNQLAQLIALSPNYSGYILSFFIELLGLLPMILIIALFPLNKSSQLSPKKIILNTLFFTASLVIFYACMPDMLEIFRVFSCTLIAITYIAVNYIPQSEPLPDGSKRLAFAFLMPLIFANTISLTPDITVNHKYVMISVMFLSIFAAFIIYNLSKYKPTAILSILLIFIMTVSGFVDFVTEYNKNIKTYSYRLDLNNPVIEFINSNTKPDEIFLTAPYVIHPILMAGRKIYYGHSYFAWSAGYDTQERLKKLKLIYSGQNPDEVRQLAKSENISYIVVENENRTSNEYKLNEKLIENTFELFYENTISNIKIFKVK